MKKFLSDLLNILKLSYQGWKEDRASRLAAALAYYTIFSLAPLLVIVIAVAGLIWQRDAVQAQVLNQIQGLVGVQGASFVASLLNSVSNPVAGTAATLIGVITLLFGALGAFNELHNSLNTVWEIQEPEPKNILQAIREVIIDRFLSFAMILGIGFLLLVSLVVSAGVSAMQEVIGNAVPLSEFFLQLVNLVISIGVITLLFAMIYKFLPDAQIAWRDVWMGALVTSVLFSLGKLAIGLYLGNSATASSFGAAGSLVLLLLWVYYSAQILFFGAEFTQVYANKYGSKIISEDVKQTTQRESAKSQQMNRRPALPVPSPTSYRESRVERENRQTARFVFGLMAMSFFIGMITTIFGLKKK